MVCGRTLSLAPLPGEPSCREDHCIDSEAHLKEGDHLPIPSRWAAHVTHFARVLKYEKGIATVHLVGAGAPAAGIACSGKDIGICMVAAFEGVISQGQEAGGGWQNCAGSCRSA